MTTQSKETTGVTRSQPAVDATGTQPQIVYVQQKAHWGRRLLLFSRHRGAADRRVSLGLEAIDLFPKLHNPFATQTTDRTGPVLLLSVKDLSRYVASEGNFQVLVDLQENKRSSRTSSSTTTRCSSASARWTRTSTSTRINEGAIVISPTARR